MVWQWAFQKQQPKQRAINVSREVAEDSQLRSMGTGDRIGTRAHPSFEVECNVRSEIVNGSTCVLRRSLLAGDIHVLLK